MKLTQREASYMANVIVSELEKRDKHAIVAVADAYGELLVFIRMENTKLHSINIAINKAWTAARAQKPTSEIGKALKDPVKGHEISFYGDPKYTGFGGGVPVKHNNLVIGAVAVSGLSQEEDEELAIIGITSIYK
jgi:glc operon protein GlcG